MKRNVQPFIVLVLAALAIVARPARAEHIRDLADVSGARENQLLGYGVVTGLSGTGDDTSAPFAAQSVLSMLRRLGVQVDPRQIRLKNVAAVVVTAKLPPFAKSGTKIDVSVSSIGNARSLSGGVLVQTLLRGADQKTYAVAQGSVLVGGFGARGQSGSSTQTGTLTSGRIPEGALIEREVSTTIVAGGTLTFALRSPSFAVAARMTEAIDGLLGEGAARAADGGSVVVTVPVSYATKPVQLIAELEELEVTPVRRGRVVVSERTGTIVAGGDVRLAPAAIVHGGITIVVREAPAPSQPAPLSKGETTVVPRSEIETSEPKRSIAYMPAAASLADVASGLGALGLSARELASVLQALRSAGALEAEVVVE